MDKVKDALLGICDGEILRDPSKISFYVVQGLTFSVAMLSLVLTFNQPAYGAARHSKDDECPEMDKSVCESLIISFLSPIKFTIKPNGAPKNGCTYSCPFPQNLVEFRGSLGCIMLVLTCGALYLRLAPHSSTLFFAWQAVYAVLAVLYFSLFVLDSDATDKGYMFCEDDFTVEDEVNNRNYQAIFASQSIQECLAGEFTFICFTDFLMSVLIAGTIFLIRKYMAFIVSQHSGAGMPKHHTTNPASSVAQPASDYPEPFAQPAF